MLTLAKMTAAEADESRRVRKRTREKEIDIADVWCLVAKQQRAAFLSPEKREPIDDSSAVEDLSAVAQGSTSAQLSTVEETPLSAEAFSQKLIEEDAVIQSSLPQYLSHVYGRSAGGAWQTDPAGTTDDESCLPSIADSEGFTVTDTLYQSKFSDTNTISSGSVLFDSSTSPEASPVLFDSPNSPLDQSTTPTTQARVSPQPMCASTANSLTVKAACFSHSVERVPNSVSGTKLTVPAKGVSDVDLVKKRVSRSGRCSGQQEKLQYKCPPSCVSLAQCSAMTPESLVSVLAIVLQGIICTLQVMKFTFLQNLYTPFS